MYNYTENTMALVHSLHDIPGVEQVRWNYVIKDKFKDMVGEDGIEFSCLVKKRLSNGFVRFSVLLDKTVYDDVEKHFTVVDNMKSKVYDYISTNVTPGQY